MPRFNRLLPAALALLTPLTVTAQPQGNQIRPPAAPLIAHDPYFSVWGVTDAAAEGITRHWTGSEQPLTAIARVDGKSYALMGRPRGTEAMPQKGVEITPTRTIYTFASNAVEVKMTFTSPLLPEDLDLFSRPATYVTWDVRALDGKAHDATVYFDASGMLAVNEREDPVRGTATKNGTMSVLAISREEQSVLGRSGDDLRIEWGHLLLGVPAEQGTGNLNSGWDNMGAFNRTGTLLPTKSLEDSSRPDQIVAAATLTFGKVASVAASRHAILAYDDEYSIQYFGRNLRPYWRRNGMDGNALLATAEKEYAAIMARCVAFDTELMGDLRKAGGEDYAQIGALAYRQAFAAQKVVADANGQPLMFSKENNSNGCIATVDILYPAGPQLLLFSPTMLKASLRPILDYSSSGRWKWAYAPHDLGQYPLANGQVYGGGERSEEGQMPVEESGNMLILMAALAEVEGNAEFSRPYWPTLQRWAVYLADKGFDPESQLSTDDFSGYLAHNTNLSMKAIEALGAYAKLAERLGMASEATKYRKTAEEFAARWQKEAAEGNTTRLAFDKPGTWSQKYNLVWDRILGFDLFPKSVARRELDFYRTKLNPYGIPLDNRADFTKLDWTIWSATLTGERADFDALVGPTARFLRETPDRVPMTDWHRTEVPRQVGFKARSVVGGVFIKMLDDKATWSKWAARDTMKLGTYAPFPKPPVVTAIVPTSEERAVEWAYRFDNPGEGWNAPGADLSSWKKGAGGFGSSRNQNTESRTEWTSDDIWIRRDFELSDADLAKITSGAARLTVFHDDDAEVYVNGKLIARLGGATGQYESRPIRREARSAFVKGRNTIAIHVRETGGDQYIDAGFSTIEYPDAVATTGK